MIVCLTIWKIINAMGFKNIKIILSNLSAFFLDLIFPPRCIICNEIFPKTEFCEKIHICHKCEDKVRFLKSFSSVCKKCSRPIDDDNILCAGCQVLTHSYDVCFSCVLYENEMRESLLSYKFNDARYKYRDFAEIMLSEMNRISPFPHVDIICSVPVSKKRKKRREFDHTACISEYISKKTGIPYSKKALIKIKDTPPQSTLSFKERQLSVKGAFKVQDKSAVFEKTVLLIDDIYTTGATVSEIAKILKRAGARYVVAFTLCITPDIDTGDDLKA